MNSNCKILTIIFLNCFLSNLIYGQGSNPWFTNGNNIGPANFLGTTVPQPLRIKTNGTNRAQFTTNNALSSITGDNGDGLRIIDPDGGANGGVGHLDLFCSNNNGGDETHIVFGPSGQISGQASRFELYGKLNGFI